jgi:autotransporter passenger strand-loop-strand repeat protein
MTIISGKYVLSGPPPLVGASVVSGGDLEVHSNGVASNTSVYSGGDIFLAFGGSDFGTTVFNGGFSFVNDGATASDTKVESGGAQYVASGGEAIGTMVASGGYMAVSAGSAVDTTVNGGVEYVTAQYSFLSYGLASGFASATTVNRGGVLDLADATAIATTLNSGGLELQVRLSTGVRPPHTPEFGLPRADGATGGSGYHAQCASPRPASHSLTQHATYWPRRSAPPRFSHAQYSG